MAGGSSKTNLREQLEHTLAGRVCFMGVGNAGYADDALGLHLAQQLLEAGVPDVVVAGNSPDRCLGSAASMKFDHLVFLDTAEFGAAPGSVVFLDSHQIAARYPQISTHKISLGVLAGFVESNGVTRAWLLGVQPESLKEGNGLSPKVRKTLGVLLELLVHLRTQNARTRETTLC